MFAVLALVIACCICGEIAADDLTIPWSTSSFSADEGCQWVVDDFGLGAVGHNANYLAAPRPGEDWVRWLKKLQDYRTTIRNRLHASDGASIELRYDGVRAWIRTDRRWAFAADPAPGESIIVRGEARWYEGCDRLGMAFDWCDRAGNADGAWRGWSMGVASTMLAHDDRWHPFQIAVTVPEFDVSKRWARPILGMDATIEESPGRGAVRNLEIIVPRTGARQSRMDAIHRALPRSAGFDDSLYRRDDLRWAARNFVCGFVFIYDRAFWDPDNRVYRVGPLCDEAVREFGGYDSIVLWQAYPRIGADRRNQFDFFRDMPGGLAGVTRVVREFHERNVKVFLPYNPWDTGTRRESDSDPAALARLVADTGADGLFLDTMFAASDGLRAAVDTARPGIVFEPEGSPSVEQIQQCNSSWAQWFSAFPEIGVLYLKWIEPRHMQHQIRRWDKSHQAELAAAWLNGSGVLVWENVFGSWNPWSLEDRATLRRMAPVLRHFADHFSSGLWLPYYSISTPGAYASCWEYRGSRLWTLVRLSGDAQQPITIEVDHGDAEFYDLWSGTRIEPQRTGGKLRLSVPVALYGAIASLPRGTQDIGFDRLLAGQRNEVQRPTGESGEDSHGKAAAVVEPTAPPECDSSGADVSRMLKTTGGAFAFQVRHMRRECGCYADPGTPPDQWDRFLTGTPHDAMIEHKVRTTLPTYWIEPRVVTNGEFEKFLQASGYRPKCAENFLKHWGGGRCPALLRDRPVVYVDLADARAYATWAKKRVPTEWQWQRAAEVHDKAFQRGEVWEWTESQRDDGHTRFVLLRGGCRWKAEGSIWYFPTGEQPIDTHAKFLLLDGGLDRCDTIGFRCLASGIKEN